MNWLQRASRKIFRMKRSVKQLIDDDVLWSEEEIASMTRRRAPPLLINKIGNLEKAVEAMDAFDLSLPEGTRYADRILFKVMDFDDHSQTGIIIKYYGCDYDSLRKAYRFMHPPWEVTQADIDFAKSTLLYWLEQNLEEFHGTSSQATTEESNPQATTEENIP